MLMFENAGIPTNATHHTRRVARYSQMKRRTYILAGVSGGLMVLGMFGGLWIFVAIEMGVLG
jgi:hypothetical protein